MPSTVSAIKVDGQRAYARARAGEEVALAARPVVVSRFDVLAVRPVAPGEQGVPDDAPPALDVDVRVTVSSGTYVRALARDLGSALGVGGHLTALRRTRVGGYGLDVASTLRARGPGGPRRRARDPAARAGGPCDVPVRELTPEQATALSYGQWIDASGTPGTTAAMSPEGELVALVEDTRRGGKDLARPVLVLAPPDASGSASCPGRGSLVQRGPGASPSGPPPPPSARVAAPGGARGLPAHLRSSRVHLWTDLSQVPRVSGPSVVTIGNFDGVHRGHAQVLGRIVDLARERDARAVAVTFHRTPRPCTVRRARLSSSRASRTGSSCWPRRAWTRSCSWSTRSSSHGRRRRSSCAPTSSTACTRARSWSGTTSASAATTRAPWRRWSRSARATASTWWRSTTSASTRACR